MNFELKIEGIKPKDLIELQGDKGPFYICRAGGKPEMENCFFYGDDRHQFCFYADVTKNGDKKYKIDVNYTSEQRLRGGLVKIPKEDIAYIESNVRKLLETRSFYAPDKPAQLLYEVCFTWGIGKCMARPEKGSVNKKGVKKGVSPHY